MVSFPCESQWPVCWMSVTWCFVLLAALCCCNGVLHQEALNTAAPLQSASESSRMRDSTEQPETAAEYLGALLDAADGAVVTLVAGNARVAVHRAVLAAGSPKFSAMLRPDTVEASNSEVNISGMERPVLRLLVAYLYTGRAPELPSMAPQLLAAAEKYGVRALRDTTELQLLKHLDVQSAAATAVVAVKYSRDTLKKAAITFIKDHIFEVLATQGWEEVFLNHPREVVQIYRLLTETLAKTSTTTIAYSTPTTTAAQSTTATNATSTGEDSMPPASTTPTASTAAPTTTGSTSTPVAAATHTATAQPSSDLSQTAATAALTTAVRHTLPPGATAVSRFQSLSAKERDRRLIQAVKEGAEQEVKVLLAVGVDVRVSDRRRITALHWAAVGGHEEVAQRLLQAGAEVDARTKESRSTPLHWAAVNGHAVVVRLLLASSADFDARNAYGWTPLHLALRQGHAEAAAALLEAGADKRARDNFGWTPLDWANQKSDQLIQMLQ